MRWFLGFLVMLTASPALAFEGEIDAKSIGDASHQAEFTIHVSNAGDVRMDTTVKQGRDKARRASPFLHGSWGRCLWTTCRAVNFHPRPPSLRPMRPPPV